MHYAATSALYTKMPLLLLLEEPLAVVGALRFFSPSSVMKNRFGKFLVPSKMSLVFMLSPHWGIGWRNKGGGETEFQQIMQDSLASYRVTRSN